ncbi:MAG: right-handed parallel beta-helix repeat-containing protein [Geminicoccaceae bacterium]
MPANDRFDGSPRRLNNGAQPGRSMLGFLLDLIGLSLALWIGISSPTPAAPQGFGAETKGGLSGQIVRVTTLEPDGPGSLHDAIEMKGPRLVVFEVGGQIALTDELIIRNPNVTLAGQTAPSPGITLVGAGVIIKTHDVVLEHLRIRIGDGPGPSAENRDGISIVGKPLGDRQIYNVLIDNCSVAWSIDEGIAFIYPGVTQSTVRDTIIAESLSHSLHPKGPHSMALLVGTGARNIAILNNLFAHNTYRNPVVGADASAFVANNLIYDFGLQAIHVYGEKRLPAPTLVAVGNVGILGPSNRGRSGLIFIPKSANPNTKLYLNDNIGPDGTAIDNYLSFAEGAPRLELVNAPPLWPDGFKPSSAATLESSLLDTVGAWPAQRDSTDRRIVAQVQGRSGTIIDSPKQVGGLDTTNVTGHTLTIPGESLQVGSEAREALLSEWLEARRRAIGDYDD